MENYWELSIEAGYYDKIYKKGLIKRKGFQSNWHLTTLKKIEPYLIKGIDHLDYATGPGTLVGNFSRSRSIGVDLSEKQINFAKEKYSGYLFFELDNFNYKAYEEKFDVITVLGLFEFINLEDIEKIMKEFSYMLKQNGKLIITTPNFKLSLKTLLNVSQYFGKTGYNDIYKSKFVRSSFEKFLQGQKNFDVVKIENFLNLGSIFSFFSHSLSLFFERIFNNIFYRRFGFLLFAELRKK